MRRRCTLAGAAVGWRVAGASLDRDRQAHVFDWASEIARDVGGQRLQRADIERVQPGTRIGGEIDQAGQEAGERLAAAGRGDQQDAFTRAGGLQHGYLMRPRCPALFGKPCGEWFR